ncbi:hypothetical protein NFI96_022588 [Prochilodus magdalenae]|nr:hypothetical protein NFI96_022588 [Prochilodus magdalenae]
MAATVCRWRQQYIRSSYMLLATRSCFSVYDRSPVHRICGSVTSSSQVRYASGGGRKGFLGEFLDTLKQELSKNKEMKENIKKFRDEAKKLEESEALQQARRKYKTIESETAKTSEVLKKKLGTLSETVKEGLEEVSRSDIGKKIKEGVEEAAKTAKQSAENVSKSGEKLGKTGAFRAISQGMESVKKEIGDIGHSGPYRPPTRLRKRSDFSSKAAEAEAKVFDANEEAMGVVLHKDSKWYQQWKDFKDNNVVFNILHQCPQDAAPQDAAPQDAAPQDAAPQDAAPQDAAHRTLPTGRCPTGHCWLDRFFFWWTILSPAVTLTCPTALLRMIHHQHNTCSVVVLWGSCPLQNRVIQYTEKQMDYSLDLYTYRVSCMVSGAGFFEMKMKYDESDNALIRASRAVTDKMTDLIGGLFSKTEMSEVLTEILKVDPSFDKDSFLKQCEKDIIPNVLEAMIQGELEVLKDWCYEATYSQLAHPIQQAKAMGLQFHSKILDIDNIDLAMGKMMEQGPVLIITFQAQLVMVIRNPKGEVVEGDPEKVLRMMYVWALCRDQEEFNPYAAWRLLDISASSTEQIL